MHIKAFPLDSGSLKGNQKKKRKRGDRGSKVLEGELVIVRTQAMRYENCARSNLNFIIGKT